MEGAININYNSKQTKKKYKHGAKALRREKEMAS
jgi:hypothetical protein